MPTKAEVISDLNWVTERISNRVWTISVGVIALALTYIVESIGTETPFLLPQEVALPATLALVALASDLLQYIAANRQHFRLLRRMEAEALTEAQYDPADWVGRLRRYAYYSKVSFCLISVSWIAALIASRALSIIGWTD